MLGWDICCQFEHLDVISRERGRVSAVGNGHGRHEQRGALLHRLGDCERRVCLPVVGSNVVTPELLPRILARALGARDRYVRAHVVLVESDGTAISVLVGGINPEASNALYPKLYSLMRVAYAVGIKLRAHFQTPLTLPDPADFPAPEVYEKAVRSSILSLHHRAG